MAQKKTDYGNESISSLKGADRVRKRPGVIFGSDGLDGCEHAVFEILSNAIDEAREGHGSLITVTRFGDGSFQVEDQGRGCPVDWNENEGKYNWELVFCELYAGGKYDADGDNYEYSLGLNGLGSCATLGVSFVSSIDLIGAICVMLARGAIISAVLSIFLLPALLYVCEPLFNKTSLYWRKAKPAKVKKEKTPAAK